MKSESEILEKIRKLLRLADRSRGSTENEAKVALAKAQELMTRHNIDSALLRMERGESGGAGFTVNKGKVDHELVIGTEKELIAHAKDMANPNAHGHHHTNEVAAKPGQQSELVWTFKEPGQYAMACFEPGHYEAGMKGVINVLPSKP